ncbi:MAG TPA: hypothetical protein VM285_11630, partial [Polyangia bacterium]|nr:hypothetical protein [Polyangia bacterium]
ASCEQFQEKILARPLRIPKDLSQGVEHQVHIRLMTARYTHPPRVGASNGTRVVFQFLADLSPR